MTFALHRPADLAEAIGIAQRLDGGARFLAGGTDLIVQINKKKQAPTDLIDLGALAGLSEISEDAGAVTIGALVTHKAIERHQAFAGPLDALRQAACVIGGHQIRNRGTVGGNIANASPAADIVAPLLALDASISLVGPEGMREVALNGFFLGPGRTVCRSDEIITSIRFARLAPVTATSFLKAGRRRAMEISVVCVAVRLTLDPANCCRDARIALGAVDATPIRARDAEQCLDGQPPNEHAFARAGELAAQSCHPISDARASARYRLRLVEILTARALMRCAARIGEMCP